MNKLADEMAKIADLPKGASPLGKPLAQRVSIEWKERPQQYGSHIWSAKVGGQLIVSIHQSFMVSRGEKPYWAARWELDILKRSFARLAADDREGAMKEAEGVIILWLKSLGAGIEGPLHD